jgi:hypothetical protein
MIKRYIRLLKNKAEISYNQNLLAPYTVSATKRGAALAE